MAPPRKDPEKRARRNHVEEHELPGGVTKAPRLPRSYRVREWKPEQHEHVERTVQFLAETRAWWAVWVASPQATRFTSTTWQRVLMLARLVDRFHRGEFDLMGEIRLNEAKLGGTPEDLQRLHWRVVDKPRAGAAAKATASGDGVQATPAQARQRSSRSGKRDPRLHVVK